MKEKSDEVKKEKLIKNVNKTQSESERRDSYQEALGTPTKNTRGKISLHENIAVSIAQFE